MSNAANKAMKQAELDALFEAARQAMPNEVRKADLLAQLRRIHYEASIRKGFTADEALTLCMTIEM